MSVIHTLATVEDLRADTDERRQSGDSAGDGLVCAPVLLSAPVPAQ